MIMTIKIALVFLYLFLGVLTAGIASWYLGYSPEKMPDFVLCCMIGWPFFWIIGASKVINILLKKYLGEPPV